MDQPGAMTREDNEAAGRGGAPRRWPELDYSQPPGAPALYAPDSIAWHVFKNPVSLFIGGVAAVLLEFGEPRVRSGVWGHSMFPYDPITRMRRTGHVAHVSTYAPREVAERVIARVVRMHERVRGETPDGVPYHANDPALLNWVQATVGYGFMEAYAAYAHPLTDAQRDRFYRETQPAARLFGATGAPRSLAEQREQFNAMRGALEPHPIVLEFLGIVTRAPAVPRPLAGLQGAMVRAAVELLPDWVIARLELRRDTLPAWERRLLRGAARLLDRVPVPGSPPVQASRRLGLPGSYLYVGRGRL